MNVEIRFDSSQEGPAGEIIGSITMDREKVDAVDWNQINPAYSFSYAPSGSDTPLSSEVQIFNRSSGYSLAEVPTMTATSDSTDAGTIGSEQIVGYIVIALGLLILLWR